MLKATTIGGSGFIGTYLLSILPSEEIANIDKNDSVSFAARTVKADVRNLEELRKALKPSDFVVLLAAEHRDDVSPKSLYYDVNETGTANVLEAMDSIGINRIIFTSSVAVYGLNKNNPTEEHPVDPFNHYGKSKFAAEALLKAWYDKEPQHRTLVILRPTVVFGPGNKGNVYNLLRQLVSGRFMRIGSGQNKKSMAYVKNIAAFIRHLIYTTNKPGYYLYNYADKPDLTMNELIKTTQNALKKKISFLAIPYPVGYAGGLVFDLIAAVTKKKFPISAIRVKKFCATTQFSSDTVESTVFSPPYTLQQGLIETIDSI